MKKMLAKVKNSRVAKWFTVASLSAMMAVMMCFNCFAADGESSAADLAGTLTTSFNSISDQIFTYIGIALPIALGIVAAIFGIKFAVRFFKNIANK